MTTKKIIREGYISDLDLFLREFDESHPDFCQARLAEIQKHQKIAAERDGIVEKPATDIFEVL